MTAEQINALLDTVVRNATERIPAAHRAIAEAELADRDVEVDRMVSMCVQQAFLILCAASGAYRLLTDDACRVPNEGAEQQLGQRVLQVLDASIDDLDGRGSWQFPRFPDIKPALNAAREIRIGLGLACAGILDLDLDAFFRLLEQPEVVALTAWIRAAAPGD